VLPAVSVAEQVTVVVPIAKVEPEAGEQVGVNTPLTVSRAEAVKVTAAPVEPVASTVMFVGTVTTGGVVSNGQPLASTVVPATVPGHRSAASNTPSLSSSISHWFGIRSVSVSG
jgi:hypothetical protein